MHKQVIAGAGLNLYYNALRFYIIVFVIATLFTSFAYWNSGFARVHLSSETGTCAFTSEGDERATALILEEYHWQMCCSLGLLWAVLVVISLRHAYRQHI